MSERRRLPIVEWLARRWADFPVRRKGLVVLAIPLLPLVLLTLLIALLSRGEERDVQRQFTRTLAAGAAAQRTFRLTVEADTAARGYFLLRTDDSLRRYERAQAEIAPSLQRLNSLADPRRHEDFARLQSLVEAYTRQLAAIVNSARSSGGAPPSGLIEQGNAAMQAVREQFLTIETLQNELLTERTRRVSSTARWLWIIAILSIPLGIAGGIIGILLFTSGISRRLTRLARNAGDLAEGKPFETGSDADDELGQLERRLAETAALLAEQREKARIAHDEVDRFFTLAPEMFCIAGTDGFFKRVNAAWTDVLGWSREDMMARPYLDIIHPDDREATIREAGALADGRMTVHFENRYACKDGTYKWLQWKAAAVPDQQRIFAAARDITPQKEAEATIQRAKDTADQANQAKSVFLSRMSHDLRTPLNAVLGFAQLLEMEATTPGQLEQTRQIIRAGRHLLDLINEVLDIAHVESGRLSLSLEPVAVAGLLSAAVELIHPLAEQKAIAVRIESFPADWHVRADRRRLMQVVVNLLSNAIKYNREGGHVRLSCAETDDWRRITITDTGFGLTPEQQAVVFNPFERLNAAQSTIEGTGLGLSVAKGFTEAMGGRIGLDSVPQEGSTFWIELPSVAAPSGAVADTDVVEAPVAHALADRGTVLYIEDNASNIRVLEGVLAHRPGVKLLTAVDAQSGFALVQRERPDLILLDMHLPDASGEDVLWRLQANAATRNIPVVALSADATPGRITRALTGGARHYLTKPLDVARVLALFDEYCPEVESTRSARVS